MNDKWGYMPLGKVSSLPDRLKAPNVILADEPMLKFPKSDTKYEKISF